MIYTILRIAWWSLCLGIGFWTVSNEWSDSDEDASEKVFASVIVISVCVLVAAAVQALFTWAGIVF